MSFRSVFSNLRAWYSEINPANLTGAIDVIVVEQEDGTFVSSPFHVRFGKLGVLKAKEKIVDIEVNGEPVDVHMKLDDNGTAFFVEGLDESELYVPELATSPLPSAILTPKSWNEDDREACSRSLLEDFDDDSFGKNKPFNRSKRKRKTRPKHDTIEAPIDAAQEASAESSGNDEQDLAHNSLLLSRLPDLPLTDSLIMKESKAEEDALMSGTSLPINIEPRIRYFSEPDISNDSSRSGSPVLSDTEFETCRGTKNPSRKESEQNWEWGKLPSTTPVPTRAKDQVSSSQGDNSVSRKTSSSGWGISSYLFGSKMQKSNVGVYLDELKNDDEEMLKIYLGNRSRSNTMSRDTDDAESGKGHSLPMSPVEGGFDDNFPLVDISFCGGLSEDSFSSIRFEQSKVTFDDFVTQIEARPDVLADPNLVVRIKDSFYKWEHAAPLIMSHVLYSRSLPSHLIEKLKNKPEEKVDRTKKSSWWPFGGGTYEKEQLEPSTDAKECNVKIQVFEEEAPAPPQKQRQDTTSSSSDEDLLTVFGMAKKDRFKKTLRLSSDAIKCLNLKKGSNEVQFSVTTAYQGTTRCFCHVYLWNYTDKIVISDIDGTITKSDVLGHVLPIIGRDWAQCGVASLFTKIVNNGYHIVYLSARAIGQASITKEYLTSIRQGEVNLPDGPIFLNPTSLVNAFHREVIVKKPEEFKIACLRDIRNIFPRDKNPFYAGYGNRVNDVWAYQAVGIPMSRIFTINPKGELRHELTNAFQTSYEDQSLDVDRLYPSLELRLNLAASLGRSAFGPQQKKIKPKVEAAPEDDTSPWAPRPIIKQDDSDVEDDIFEMSSNESPCPDPDEESVYGDALSRKESVVWQNGGNC